MDDLKEDINETETQDQLKKQNKNKNLLIAVLSAVVVVVLIVCIVLIILLVGKNSENEISENTTHNTNSTNIEADSLLDDDSAADVDVNSDNSIDQSVIYTHNDIIKSINDYMSYLNLPLCKITHSEKPGKDIGSYYWIGTCYNAQVVFIVYEINGVVTSIDFTHPIWNKNYGYLYKSAKELSNAIVSLSKLAVAFLPDEQQSLFLESVASSLHLDGEYIKGTASECGWTLTIEQNTALIDVALKLNSSTNNSIDNYLDEYVNENINNTNTDGNLNFNIDNSAQSIHIHSFVEHEGKTATCTESGYSSYNTCSSCSYSSYNEILPLGHNYIDATCTSPKTCLNCGDSVGIVLPHDMFYSKCRDCDYTDFSSYVFSANKLGAASWYYIRRNGSVYLDENDASINIDSNGNCNVSFADYSYSFTLVQSLYERAYDQLIFDCYKDGEKVENVNVEYFFTQKRCTFAAGSALGFDSVVLNFDM